MTYDVRRGEWSVVRATSLAELEHAVRQANQQYEAACLAREAARVPVAPIAVVYCYEADDFTSPRGKRLPSLAEYAFSSRYYGRLAIGGYYAVDAAGVVLGEALDVWPALRNRLRKLSA